MASPSPFLPSSPLDRERQGFVRSDAPSPPSSFDGPRYIKELFEVVAPEISFNASEGSPRILSPAQLDLDLRPIPPSPHTKVYPKKFSHLGAKPKSKSSLSNSTTTFKTVEIPPARISRATRALSSSLRTAQQHLATVITLREQQRAHAASQTSILQELEADNVSAEMDVQSKRNELEAVEAEMRALKGSSGGLKGRFEKRTRLPLKPRNRTEIIEKAGWPVNLNKPMTRSNSTTRTI